MKQHEIFEIYSKALTIYNDEFLDWEQKFNLIFSFDISQKIYNSEYRFDYYDPDTTYEEDVTAFMNAFRVKMRDIK
jgi:hypothetical protein